jgi:hypothetical protein
MVDSSNADRFNPYSYKRSQHQRLKPQQLLNPNRADATCLNADSSDTASTDQDGIQSDSTEPDSNNPDNTDPDS